MELFVFFALPLATILLSIVLQKVLRNPILVAITVFAIFLIVSFASFSDMLANALVATIIYTILAFITAVIVRLLCRINNRFNDLNDSDSNTTTNNEVTLNASFVPNNGGRTGRIRGCWRRM